MIIPIKFLSVLLLITGNPLILFSSRISAACLGVASGYIVKGSDDITTLIGILPMGRLRHFGSAWSSLSLISVLVTTPMGITSGDLDVASFVISFSMTTSLLIPCFNIRFLALDMGSLDAIK